MQLKPRSLLGELGSIFQENGFTGSLQGRIGDAEAMEVVRWNIHVFFWVDFFLKKNMLWVVLLDGKLRRFFKCPMLKF